MKVVKMLEGTCGHIIPTTDNSVVVKKLWRRAKAQNCIVSHRGAKQCEIQRWAHKLCTRDNGFSVLRVPNAWEPYDYEYKMTRIDISNPIYPDAYKNSMLLLCDLKLFYDRSFRRGYFPCDFELYLQADGTVAMIDFDKFGNWNKDGSVVFPWGAVWNKEVVDEQVSELVKAN